MNKLTLHSNENNSPLLSSILSLQENFENESNSILLLNTLQEILEIIKEKRNESNIHQVSQ